MTTKEKPISGYRSKDKPADLDKYNKTSKTAATGNYMRNFSRNRTSGVITTWDDTDYLYVLGNYFYPLADVSGGVDDATTVSAQMESILDAAWHAFYSNANLKDRVDAEEAAWKLYFSAALFIAIEIQLQYNTRCYLPAYAESDIVPGDPSNITYFSQSSFDIFCASMKDFPIPKGVFEIVDVFCTTIIQVAREYERYTVRIPGMFILPFKSLYDLEDLEAARALMRVNLGNFTTHAKKFGLKIGAWRDPVKPTVKDVNDVDVIAMLNHMVISFYDDIPAVDWVDLNGGMRGANLTTEYTLHEFFFKDTPNESLVHVFAPFFGTYNNPNNPYGGLILKDSPTAVLYNLNFGSVGEYGTNFGVSSLTDPGPKVIVSLLKCTYDNVADTFHNAITGTNITVLRGNDDIWPLAIQNKLFKGTGRAGAETNNDLLTVIGRLLV